MQPRFSLRLMLVIFTLAAVSLYVFIVRPTQLANRFVAAIQGENFTAAHELLGEDDWRISKVEGQLQDRVGAIDRVFIEVFPCEWSDVVACRRRLLLRTARHDETDGRYVDWTDDTEITAGVCGVAIATPSLSCFEGLF